MAASAPPSHPPPPPSSASTSSPTTTPARATASATMAHYTKNLKTITTYYVIISRLPGAQMRRMTALYREEMSQSPTLKVARTAVLSGIFSVFLGNVAHVTQAMLDAYAKYLWWLVKGSSTDPIVPLQLPLGLPDSVAPSTASISRWDSIARVADLLGTRIAVPSRRYRIYLTPWVLIPSYLSARELHAVFPDASTAGGMDFVWSDTLDPTTVSPLICSHSVKLCTWNSFKGEHVAMYPLRAQTFNERPPAALDPPSASDATLPATTVASFDRLLAQVTGSGWRRPAASPAARAPPARAPPARVAPPVPKKKPPQLLSADQLASYSFRGWGSSAFLRYADQRYLLPPYQVVLQPGERSYTFELNVGNLAAWKLTAPTVSCQLLAEAQHGSSAPVSVLIAINGTVVRPFSPAAKRTEIGSVFVEGRNKIVVQRSYSASRAIYVLAVAYTPRASVDDAAAAIIARNVAAIPAPPPFLSLATGIGPVSVSSTAVASAKNAFLAAAFEDSDLAVLSVTISPICPLGLMRMRVPARGAACTHASRFFDLATFLALLDHARTLTMPCPICRVSVNPASIVIDLFVLALLANPDYDTDAHNDDGITILPNGSIAPPSAPSAPAASSAPAPPSSSRKRSLARSRPTVSVDLTDPTANDDNNDHDDDHDDDDFPANPFKRHRPLPSSTPTRAADVIVLD